MTDFDYEFPPPKAATEPTPSPSEQLLRYFEYGHLPDHLAVVSALCHNLAHRIESDLPDGPEKTTGLRKLLEAKDCFVRAALPQDPG